MYNFLLVEINVSRVLLLSFVLYILDPQTHKYYSDQSGLDLTMTLIKQSILPDRVSIVVYIRIFNNMVFFLLEKDPSLGKKTPKMLLVTTS